MLGGDGIPQQGKSHQNLTTSFFEELEGQIFEIQPPQKF